LNSEETFNFVATTYRNLENELKHELETLLSEFLPIAYLDLGITGIVAGKLYGDPLQASKTLWNTAYHEPWRVKRTLRFIPIKYSCASTIENMGIVAGKLLSDIPLGSTYKIEAELRRTKLTWGEVINAVAQRMVGLKAKMKDPDYVIQVQVLGDICGMSALRAGEVFRALQAKLAGSEFP
jgi:tRNA(Ser,Leu) C12 N-acetylase TAN1